MRLLVLAVLLAVAVPVASAQSFTPLVEGALELGGDDLFAVYFTNGSSQEIQAGQGGTLAVGVEGRPVASLPVAVRGTVGFKFVGTAADNANIYFTRIPVELVARYEHAGGVHAGVGATAHLFNRLHGDDFLDDKTFDAAFGPTVEVGWKWVALTYTSLSYTDEQGNTFDAAAPGLSFVYRIRR